MLVLAALVLGLGGALVAQRDRIPEALSVSGSIPFANLSKAARGPDGGLAVVFDSNKRIARVAPDGSLEWLAGARNTPEKGFYFANEIAFDPDGRLYVASTYLDTAALAVNREAIVRFSPAGRPEAVLFALEHDPAQCIDNIGLIRSLQWTPAGLRFCVVEADGIRSLRIDAGSGAPAEDVRTPFPGAAPNVIFATVSADGRELAYATAATEIYTAAPGGTPVRRYDGRELPDEGITAANRFSTEEGT